MKLLLSADLHGVPADPAQLGNLAQARGGALVVLAGDLLDLFAEEPAAGQAVHVAAWLRTLAAQAGPVAVCSGNHDVDGGEGAQWLRELGELAEPTPTPHARLITDGHHAVLADLVVSVCPYWNILDWGEAHRERLRAGAERVWLEGRRLATQHRLPWAVLHHEPPQGSRIAAGAGRPDASLGPGSRECARWVRESRPDYLFCGHIHQAPFSRGGSWAEQVPGTDTWCFNPGRRQTGPCLVELDTTARQARWFRCWHTEDHLALGLNKP